MLRDHDEEVQGRQGRGREWQPHRRSKRETTEGDRWREQVTRAVNAWQMKQEEEGGEVRGKRTSR